MKRNTMKLLSMAAVLALLGAGAMTASAATIVNLGFDPLQVNNGRASADVNNGADGWNTTNGNFDIGYGPVSASNPEGNPKDPAEIAFHDSFVATATGSNTFPAFPGDTIIAGNSYTISVLTNSLLFDGGWNPTFGQNPEIGIMLTVKTNDDTVLASQTLVTSVSDLNFASHSVTFVAPAGTDGKYFKLEFASLAPTPAGYNALYALISGIDATTESAVPEPASLGLLGLGAVALLRRRK